MPTTLLAAAAAALTLGAWVGYMSTIPRGVVAVRPTTTIAVHLGGIALAVLSLAVGPRTILSTALAATAIGLAAFFFYLLSQRKTPVGQLTVAVGDALPSFSAKRSDDSDFESESLAGKRVLLKFFRGHW